MIPRQLFILGAIALACSTIQAQYPPTRLSPTVDSYHGVAVEDNYRWLENWSDVEVKRWSESQNAYARRILDKLPNVDAIRERTTEIMSAKVVSFGDVRYAGGKYFARKSQPPKEQPFLITFDSLDTANDARVLFDPNVVDAKGTTSVDWFEPSPDGKLLAISISRGGSEVGDVSVFDTATASRCLKWCRASTVELRAGI